MLPNLSKWQTKYASLPDSVNAWRQICGKSLLPENFLIRNDEEVSTVYGKGYVFAVQHKFSQTANIYCENLDKRFEIPRTELKRLELDKEKFCQSVAESLGLSQTVHSLQGCDGYSIGSRRLGRKTYSVFLLFGDDNTQSAISEFTKEIPIVYIVAKSILSKDTSRWIEEQKGFISELQQSFVWQPAGITNTLSIAELVGFEGTLNVPDTQLVKWVKRRPENPHWGQIKITLDDPDYLLINFGSQRENIHYGQLPPFHNKSGKIKQKNKLWFFFLQLADNKKYDHEVDKNYLPKLRKFFQNFFELYDSDPLPISKEGIIDHKFELHISDHIMRDAKLKF